MARDINSTISDAVEGNFGWVLMLQLDLDSGSVYMHTGVGEIPWNGQTWLGVGSMSNISGLVETADGGDGRITVGLSGIPIAAMPDFVDEFTTEDTAGREWFLYIAKLDDDGVIDGDASLLNSGLTGAVDMVDGDDSSVTLSLVTEAALMQSTLFYRMTDEDQQRLFPGDKFCEFMNDLGDEIRWGTADPKQIGVGSEHSRNRRIARDRV